MKCYIIKYNLKFSLKETAFRLHLYHVLQLCITIYTNSEIKAVNKSNKAQNKSVKGQTDYARPGYPTMLPC